MPGASTCQKVVQLLEKCCVLIPGGPGGLCEVDFPGRVPKGTSKLEHLRVRESQLAD